MPYATADDSARIYFKDWGPRTGARGVIVFSHGWPLTADSWDPQLLHFGKLGYRVIAHDRRSHGRSDQTWDGNHMDQYADDLAALIALLDLRDIVLVGHSTGGGEITRYMGRHGTGRIAKAVLFGAVPPLMLKTASNPGGLPIAAFDAIRKGVYDDRSQFYYDLTMPFYGYNRPGAAISEGVRRAFWLQGMAGGLKGQHDCIREFSEVDYTADLKKIDVPVLVAHGDDDQIVPIGASAMLSSKILKNATLKVWPGGDHGYSVTHQDAFNADIRAFIES